MNKQWWAPLGTFAAIGALGVSTALLTGGGSAHAPRPLRLADGTADAARSALSAPTASGDYELVGTLPEGRPADARAWTLSPGVDADAVDRLAKALHAGTPVRHGSGWSTGNLTVNDSGDWYFSPCAGDDSSGGTVSSDGATSSFTGCAIAVPGTVSGGGSVGSPGVEVYPAKPEFSPGAPSAGAPNTGSTTAAPPPTPIASPLPAGPPDSRSMATPVPVPVASPSASEIRAAADPVFQAVGLDPSDARLDAWSAWVDRTVDGSQTVGLRTRVGVDATGTITDASGWLGTLVRGDSYPLITAQQAFDALPVMPRMMMACPVGPDGTGCPSPAPVAITGAHLGLTVHPLLDGGQVLVPAWLFEVRGSSDPIAAVAVDPKYLPQPEPSTPVGGTPASDNPVPPPAETRTPFSFDKASRVADADAVSVEYGDSGSCPHTNVTHQVKESADSVSVFFEADSIKPLIACTDDYRAMDVVIKLQAPLGDRTVIDGTTGREVPLS